MIETKPKQQPSDSPGSQKVSKEEEILPRVLATIRSEHNTVIQLIKDKAEVRPAKFEDLGEKDGDKYARCWPSELGICYKLRYWEIDQADLAYSCVVQLWEYEAMELAIELLKEFGLGEQIEKAKATEARGTIAVHGELNV